MRVSILSFNHPQLTLKCVKSVLAHVAPEQIILTHNGSRKENVDLLINEFPNIKHLILESNRGYSGGVNASLSNAFRESPWVFFVTNDCELLNAPTIPLNPGFFAPTLFRRKVDKIDSLGGLFTPLTGRLLHIRESSYAKKVTEKSPPFRFDINRFRFFYVPGTAFYLHSDVFNMTGPFDESLHTYWEDVDYSMRVRKLGLSIGIHLETQLIHKVGKTCHKDPFYTNILFKRNRKTISAKYTPYLLHPLQSVLLKDREKNRKSHKTEGQVTEQKDKIC